MKPIGAGLQKKSPPSMICEELVFKMASLRSCAMNTWNRRKVITAIWKLQYCFFALQDIEQVNISKGQLQLPGRNEEEAVPHCKRSNSVVSK